MVSLFLENLESVRKGMSKVQGELQVTLAIKKKMERDLEASRLQEKAGAKEIDSLKSEVEALKAKRRLLSSFQKSSKTY